jgi:hypothetical protein
MDPMAKPVITDDSLIQDILTAELAENNRRITVSNIYQASFLRDQSSTQRYLRTPKEAKWSLSDVYEKIREAIENYETRQGTQDINKITFTEDDGDRKNHTEIISVKCTQREPGLFAQGTPYDAARGNGVKNLTPRLREEINDPDNQGYSIAITGKWFDNVIRLTCWAKTNKRANYRADWLETLMDEYAWWFKMEGIDRLFFIGRREDKTEDESGNRWYGRPLDYFVRTEKIAMRSEKQIEEILFKTTLSDE